MYRCETLMLADPHDGEDVTRFSEATQHGMTKRAQDKISGEDRPALR
jgi:hypothetical protein